MKTKKVTRYYCDFCGKGLFYYQRMVQHESCCSKNPNRKCNVCEDEQVPLRKLLSALDGITDQNKIHKMDCLRGKTTCPVCILTALRFHPRTSIEINSKFGTSPVDVEFDYSKEWEDFRHEERAWANRDEQGY